MLGYTDEEVKLLSARIAAEYALRRGRLTFDQITLIRTGIEVMAKPTKWSKQFEDIVTEGKLSVMERLFLGKLVFALDFSQEEE